MTVEEKDKLDAKALPNSNSEKESSFSFFGYLKSQFKNLKNKDANITYEETEPLAVEQKLVESNSKELENHNKNKIELEKEELRKKEKEAKLRAFQLESERKKYELEQLKIAEEHKRRIAQRAEEERLERERIAHEKELERQRIEKEKAEKREKERLERERIAKEKELERQRIEKEKAEKREQERLERERIAHEKELERQRIEKEKAEKREKERLERERIAREKELERQRIEKERNEKREQKRLERERIAREKKLEQARLEREQAEKRKKEFEERELAFKLADDKKKLELLEKENNKKEHENNLLTLKTSLIITDDKLEEQKALLKRLKRQRVSDDEYKIAEKKLESLTFEKQKISKEIASEKKQIEKIQKNLDLEQKLAGLKNEIYNIKKEVINEDETILKVKNSSNKLQNIFVVALTFIKASFLKYILRKNVENYAEIHKTAKNIKVKIATSLILATLLSICFLITLKFVSSAQEHYVSFDDFQTTAVDSTEEMKKQKEAEEKAKILEAQEKANAARIDSEAQDEEITAKLAGTFVSYSFDVNREITTSKKIHSFKSANWSDTSDVIEAGTKFTVDKLVSPAGYMMYHISSGEHAGQYITANEKFINIDKKDDQLANPISRPVAIKFLASQNIYSDESLNNIRVTMSSGAVLNINGYGISKNNRLIYYISDGSFVPVNPVRLTEINRESTKSKDISNENSNSSNSQKNSTTQNTSKKKTT